MSVQDKHVGFDLNETDFPELSAKMTGKKEKGRRSAVAARHAKQVEKSGAMLVKTIDDPHRVLGRRRVQRLSKAVDDGFGTNVIYSLNKQNRWQDVSALELMINNDDMLPVEVVERVMTATDTTSNVVAHHCMNSDDEVYTKKAGSKGTNMNALHIGEGKKMRGRKARKEAEAEASNNDDSFSDDTSDGSKDPKIQYTIYKPHKNHKVLAGKLFTRNYNTRKAGKTRAQHKQQINLDELEESELDQSVHIEEQQPVYKPSRDLKFCLGDYMTDTAPKLNKNDVVYVRRESIESVTYSSSECMDETESGFKQSYIIDIAPILSKPVAFEYVFLDHLWSNNFRFPEQVAELFKNEKLDVEWLDESHKRVSIDASRLVSDQPCATSTLYVVLDCTDNIKQNQVRVLMNSDVAPTGPFTWQWLKSILSDCDYLSEVVDMLAKLVAEWKEGRAPELVEKRKSVKSRFEQSRSSYQAAFNSAALTETTEVLTNEKMATLVRCEGRNSRNDSESFERIDFDNDDIEFDDSEKEEIKKKIKEYKIKCALCSEDRKTEMFELDDSWQCRDCLRKRIIEQIRLKKVPLDIPFVVPEGQSVYNILPAIIPLPLIHFYTKISVTELFSKNNLDVGELGECPSCKQLVQIEFPNSYNCARCDSCSIHWCTDCGFEPHWPMTCSTYATWIEKWDKEYKLHILDKTEHLKKIKCCCGQQFEIRDKAHHAECHGCGRVFNPLTMKCLEKYYWVADLTTGELIRKTETSDDYCPQSVETVVAAKTIKKEFSDALGKARKLRFGGGATKKNEFERSVRKLKNTHAGVEKMRDLRKTVLVTVENGLAFVYTQKKKEETLMIKQSLMQLLRLWLDIEVEVHDPRVDFFVRIEAVEALLAKSLDLIKTFLEKTL